MFGCRYWHNCTTRILTQIMIDPFLYKARTSSSVMQSLGQTGIHRSFCSSTPLCSKPPNVLLYGPGQSALSAKRAVACLEACLAQNRYTVYSINTTSFKTDPWPENVMLLVVWASAYFMNESNNLEELLAKVERYQQMGGKVLWLGRYLSSNALTYNAEIGNTGSAAVLLKEGPSEKKCMLGPQSWNGLAFAQFDKSFQPLIQVDVQEKIHTVALGNGCSAANRNLVVCMVGNACAMCVH